MKRWLSALSLIVTLGIVLTACGGNPPAPTPTQGIPVTPETGTVVATSAVATSAPNQLLTVDQALPAGTLLLDFQGNPMAQTPTGQVLGLPRERFPFQGSPDGKYSVRFGTGTAGTDLILIDYSITPTGSKPVQEGTGLQGPTIVWKTDSTGFAFADFPSMDKVKTSAKKIMYFDIASGQTKTLYTHANSDTTIPIPIAFSPDGTKLLYNIQDINAEGIGGPASEPFLLTMDNNQSQALPEEISFFDEWLKDSSGFLVSRFDENLINQTFMYKLDALTNPTLLTPENTSDLQTDQSPDGKWIAVVSVSAFEGTPTEGGQVANIYRVSLSSGERKQLTNFQAEQSIAWVDWASDGIYYSLIGSVEPAASTNPGQPTPTISGVTIPTDNFQETTWRMDLEGNSQTQIAQGTLREIVGRD